MARFVLSLFGGTRRRKNREQKMLKVSIDNIGEMAVIDCAGRIVQSEAVFKLRDAVRSQSEAEIIVVDLSDVPVIEGSGLGMLLFLQHWAQNRHIRFKLFNPRQSVRDRLGQVSSMRELEIASLDEMMALLTRVSNADTLAEVKHSKAA
jgi:anti-anti-sigma regulatory factor